MNSKVKTPFELGISLEQHDKRALNAKLKGLIIGAVISIPMIAIALWCG